MMKPTVPVFSAAALLVINTLISGTVSFHFVCPRLRGKWQPESRPRDHAVAWPCRESSQSSLPQQSTKRSSSSREIGAQLILSADRLMNRRAAIFTVPATIALATCALPSRAAEPSSMLDMVSGQADSLQLEKGLLESRVLENVLSPPPYGMEGPDIFYPSWLSGSWKVNSVTADVQAPCGVQLFGGNATFAKATDEIGSVLNYESRFIPDGNGHIVADREFNVKSIAKVAMGANSVLDVSLATPNKFSCVLSGSPSLLKVDLIVLNRRQESVDATNFHCSEVVREIVSPVGGGGGGGGPSAAPRSPLLKEIETTSLYSLVTTADGQSEVHCRQRSAAFLLPSQQDPMALKMWEMSRGRPTDVRFYDVVYTKR